ncbi:MAG: DNA alkylation repair protein [Porphyromonadaceae bacterium CG2_30_38_12]|nr:MAG: DNA alkylation repair protein [Porphyromonadaceae bacterium CG2_30_38_12]
MNSIIQNLRATLQAAGNENHRQAMQRFFKEHITCYGVKSAEISKIGKSYLASMKNIPKKELFALCNTLWQSPILEENFIACQWIYAIRKQYEAADFYVFKNWIENYIHNWAVCDTFCNRVMGDFIQMYPNYLVALKEFTKSENRWVRRAAAVSLIVPARKGLFLEPILQIAETLVNDTDDMVQKGYGWMLKVAATKHQTEVFNFVMIHQKTMPRTALRYAIEKMPNELKEKAMKKE